VSGGNTKVTIAASKQAVKVKLTYAKSSITTGWFSIPFGLHMLTREESESITPLEVSIKKKNQ